MKPFLFNLYQTRAAAYRDAVTQFITGYKEVRAHSSHGATDAEAQRNTKQLQ